VLVYVIVGKSEFENKGL